MGCGKDLAESEKVLVIKEITKVRTNKSIGERINHCVIQKNPRKRKPRPDRAGLDFFSMCDMNRLKKRRQNAWSNKRNHF